MNLDPILDRLEKVRRVKPDSFVACCPAHDDRSPSLGITDAGDRALVICRAGCTFDEIRGALGMQAYEFFDGGKAPTPVAPGVNRRELLEALALELLTAYIVTRDRAEGKSVNDADLAREKLARQRIATGWRALA